MHLRASPIAVMLHWLWPLCMQPSRGVVGDADSRRFSRLSLLVFRLDTCRHKTLGPIIRA